VPPGCRIATKTVIYKHILLKIIMYESQQTMFSQEPKLIFDGVPIILFENFIIPKENEKKYIVNDIEFRKKRNNDNNNGKNNVKVLCDYNNFIKKLYEKFILTSKKTLNTFSIHENNSEQAWTYCTNQDDIHHVWHNHINTSTINSVYYLQVPNCGGGQLEIQYKNKRFDFHPKEYDFIIFPDFLDHAPRRPYCKEYRISINLELLCNEDSEKIFSNILNNIKSDN